MTLLQRRRRPAAVSAGRLVGDRYRLVDLVGRGGMAEVWSADDLLRDRRVAVKIAALSIAEVPESRARFAEEVAVHAPLRHPHLVALLDRGDTQAELPWFVLELVEGAHLAAHLARGALLAAAVAHVGAGVAAGLDHLHRSGWVHLDVKPANLLISGTGEVKVADLGIARRAGQVDPLAASGCTLGTAAYLAPEQVTGAPLGGAADVYALGLVLLEALTGERAYRGAAREVAHARLARGPLLPVSLGPAWTGLLAAMTALDPSARPAAAEVARRLRDLARWDGVPAGAAAPAPDPTVRLDLQPLPAA